MNKVWPFSIWLLSLQLLPSCATQSSSLSRKISTELETKEIVDLSSFGSFDWEKACVLPPYTNNDAAKASLGFDWNAEEITNIHLHDSFYILAFVKGNEVVEYVEMPRRDRELLTLQPTCISSSNPVITFNAENRWKTI